MQTDETFRGNSLSGCQQTAEGDGESCKYRSSLQTLRYFLCTMLIMAVCTHHRSSLGIPARLRGDIHHQRTQRTSGKLLWLGFVLQESDGFCLSSYLMSAGFGSDVRLTYSSFMLPRLQLCSCLIGQKQHGVFSDHERIVADVAVVPSAG